LTHGRDANKYLNLSSVVYPKKSVDIVFMLRIAYLIDQFLNGVIFDICFSGHEVFESFLCRSSLSSTKKQIDMLLIELLFLGYGI
jgi:hypothetical protein